MQDDLMDALREAREAEAAERPVVSDGATAFRQGWGEELGPRKLVVEVEIQSYGDDGPAVEAMLTQIGKTIEHVVDLAEMSVGVFVKTRIESV